MTIGAAGSSFDIQSGVHQAAIPGNAARTQTNMHSLWPAAPEEGETKPLSSFPQHLICRLQREAELKGGRDGWQNAVQVFFFFLLEKDMRD